MRLSPFLCPPLLLRRSGAMYVSRPFSGVGGNVRFGFTQGDRVMAFGPGP